jgi:hypothetical protein
MRGIYLRSLLFAFGFAALLLIEALDPASRAAPAVAPTAAVGDGHRRT